MKTSIYEYDEEGVREVLRQDAIDEDRDESASLYRYLVKDNRLDDLGKAFEDREFLDKLLAEYGIRK